MKARLMFADRDLDLDAPAPSNGADLVRDLGLDALVGVMAGGDPFLGQVADVALLSSLESSEEIDYRQRILADCLRRPGLAREVYDLAGEALAAERKVFRGLFTDHPTSLLHRSVEVLDLFVPVLRKLRALAERYRPETNSEGMAALFDMLAVELDDGYFDSIEQHLRTLRFRRGHLMSATLGPGCGSSGHVLRRPRQARSWWTEFLGRAARGTYSFSIPDRDEAGWQALGALRDKGLHAVALAVAESADHVLAFFTMLRREIGFYVGCVSLHEALTAHGEPLCMPQPLTGGSPTLRCRGLYEPGLALRRRGGVVGNDVDAAAVPLVVVTGANQGGKSTFLRSVGIAQLMMGAGMFVPAESFTATVHRRVFTHYRREEDASMTSGKLEEELARMSAIADEIRPGDLLLSNESFASTNEREGSQIGRHVFGALVRSGVTVVAVTHLFDLAQSLHQQAGAALFLRAERQTDGRRTFRLTVGEPLSTSFGRDLYAHVFGAPTGLAATKN